MKTYPVGTILCDQSGTYQFYGFGWVKVGMQTCLPLDPYTLTADEAKSLGYFLVA